jgi:hypothetical protein
MRLKFFPGSELAPPQLLGEIVDLDHPQNILANVFFERETGLTVKPAVELNEQELEQVMAFAREIDPHGVRRIDILDIMSCSTRKKSMC